MAQALTILTDNTGKFATKHMALDADGQWSSKPYDRMTYYTWREVDVDGIESLADVLEGVGPHSFPIRGSIHDDKRGDAVVLRRLEFFGGSRGATPCQWVMLDLDGVDLSSVHDVCSDPEAAIEWAIYEYLPEPFQDVTCYWQLSSSAGIKPGLSCHIFVWLDRPISGRALTDYLAVNSPAVDRSPIINDVQPHYVAPPVFTNAPDPIPVRTGLMEREYDFATLPDLDVAALRQEARVAGAGSSALNDAPDFESRIALIGDGEGLAGFHEPITMAIMAAVRAAGLKTVDEEALKARLREAIDNAPHGQNRDPSRYLSDEYLDGSIRGAVSRAKEEYAKAIKSTIYPAPDEVDIVTARRQTRDAIDIFLTKATEFRVAMAQEDQNVGIFSHQLRPPVHALNIDLGVGKSRSSVEALAQVISDGAVSTAFYFVPLHVLADELVARFNQIGEPFGITAKAFRGRSRGYPTKSDDPMCPLHKEATAVSMAGGDVIKSMCKFRKQFCEHHPDNPDEPDTPCRYILQTREKATVWLLPHQMLFKAKPKGLPNPDLVVIDEAFWQSSLHGFGESGPLKVTVDSLKAQRMALDRKGKVVASDSADLNAYSQKALKVLESQPEGKLHKQPFQDAGIDAAMCRQAATFEYSRKAPAKLTPGMKTTDREKALDAWSDNGALRLGRFWQLLGKLMADDEADLSPNLTLKRDANLPQGVGTGDVLQMRWSSDIAAAYDVPTLVLDATLSEQITKRFFPQASAITNIAVEKPHQHITQITDRPVAASMIRPSDKANDTTNLTRWNNLKKLHRRLKGLAREARVRRAGLPDADGIESNVDVLCVGQKGVDDALTEIGEINGVRFEHFNNLRGVDRYRDVDTIVIVGRLRPGVSAIEDMAEALFGRSVVRVGSEQPINNMTGLRLASDEIAPVQNESLTDPLSRELLYQIREAELLQMIGRGRGVNRTAENPLNIVLLTNVALPVEVEIATTWSEAIGGRLPVICEGNSALPMSPSELSRCFKGAFPTADTARGVLNDKSRGNSYRDIPISVSPHYVTAGYKVTKRRETFLKALVDARCCDPKAALESVVGPVTECHVNGISEWHELQAVITFTDIATQVFLPAAEIMRITGRRLDADAGDTVVRLMAEPSPDGENRIRLTQPGRFTLDMPVGD